MRDCGECGGKGTTVVPINGAPIHLGARAPCPSCRSADYADFEADWYGEQLRYQTKDVRRD